jgi:hypothetical protein
MQGLCHAAWFLLIPRWRLGCSGFFAFCSAQFLVYVDAGFALGWCGGTFGVHQVFSFLLIRALLCSSRFGLSLLSYWFISIAPVRGGTVVV